MAEEIRINVTTNADKATNDLNELNEALKKLNRTLHTTEKITAAVASAFGNLANGAKDSADTATSSAKRTEKALNDVADSAKNSTDAVGDMCYALSTVVQDTAVALDPLKYALSTIVQDTTLALDPLKNALSTIVQDTTVALDPMKNALVAWTPNISWGSIEEGRQSLWNLDDVIEFIIAGFQGIGSAAQTGFSIVKTAVNALTPILSLPLKPLKSIISSVAGIGLQFMKLIRLKILRTIATTLIQGFTEGLKNAYYWAQSVGNGYSQSMDTIATATSYAKNAIATIGVNLANYLAPVLDWIVDKFVAVINAVNKVIAAFGGSGKMIVAKKVSVAYADALDNVGSSANNAASGVKDLEEALGILSFDEINALPEQPTSSSGSGSGSGSGNSTDYGSMFEEVAIDGESTLSMFFDSIKEAWERFDLTEKFKNMLSSLKEVFNSVKESFERVWQSETGEKLLNTIMQTIDNIITTIDEMATAFDEAWETAGLGDSVMESIFEVATSIYGIWEAITGAIKGIVEQIDWTILLNTLEEFNGLLSDILGWIGEIITYVGQKLQPVVKPLQQVIEKIVKFVKEIWKAVEPCVTTIVESGIDIIVDAIAAALEIISPILDVITPLVVDICNVLTPVLELISTIVSFVFGVAGTGLESFGKLLSGDTEGASNTWTEGWEENLGKLTGTWERLTEVTSETFEVMDSGGSKMSATEERIVALNEKINAVSSDVGTAYSKITGHNWTGSTEDLEKWGEIAIKGFEMQINKLQSLDGEYDTTEGVIEEVSEGIQESLETASTATSSVFDIFQTSTTKTASVVQDKFAKLGASISTTKSDVTTSVSEMTGDVNVSLGTLATNVDTKNTSIKTATSTAWQGIVSAIKTPASTMWAVTSSYFTALSDNIKSKWGGIATMTEKTFQQIGETIIKIFKNLIEPLVNVCGSIMTSIQNALNAGAKNVGYAPGYTIGQNISQGIKSGIKGFTMSYSLGGKTTSSWVPVYAYAGGGIPSVGSIFLAGESGAEIVAQGSGGTGVTNVAQIEQAMATAIKNTLGSMLRESNSYLGEIARKDNTVSVTSVMNSMSRVNRRTGRAL